MSIATSVYLTIGGNNAFDQEVSSTMRAPLRARAINTVQVNIGLTCDLACRHCHVESSPKRTEQMSWDTMELVINAAQRASAQTIDITGGAPEMNPHFRQFVVEARGRGLAVTVHTNLTILTHDGYQDMPAFFSDHGVHLVASLPCYTPENVKKQRGLHVYEESIEVIRQLNAVGYGLSEGLLLDLVYNPGGPTLPPPQAKLEEDYRRELGERCGISFSRLLTITNMPIGRFLHDLDRDGTGNAYRLILKDGFNAETLEGLMCRDQIHVSHDGTLHDCDFNYALNIPTAIEAPTHIRDFNPKSLAKRRINTGEHCFGCTAGSGSSCGGAIA